MTPLALIAFIPPLFAAALLPYVLKRRATPGARALAMSLLAVTIWALAYGVAILPAVDSSTRIFFIGFQYVGIVLVPLAWIAFAFEYTGKSIKLKRRSNLLLAIVPVITVILAFTNTANLMRGDLTEVTVGPFLVATSVPGPWFYVNAAYAYIWVLWGTVLIFQMYRRSARVYKQQALTLLLGAGVAWVSNILNALNRSPIPNLDLTSFAFSVTMIVWAWALFRYRLLDIAPVAHDAVFKSMTDVAIVLDQNNRIVDINPAGQQRLGRTAAALIGQPIESALADWPNLVTRCRGQFEAQEEITLSDIGAMGQRNYDLRITSISDRHNQVTGRLVVLRDITEGRLVQALSDSEQRLRQRAEQLQSMAEVIHTITAIQELGQLLPAVPQLISDRFGFNLVGIFLLAPDGQSAVLTAANGEVGQRLVAEHFELEISQANMVSDVIRNGKTLVLTDAHRQTSLGPQPDLPLLQSEVAAPLIVRGATIGVLDVHSSIEAAFTDEDVIVLTMLAAQVATAIENARAFEKLASLADDNHRLLERSEKAVQELDALTQRLTGAGWGKFLAGQGGELTVENIQSGAVITRPELEEMSQAAARGETVTTSDGAHRAIALPIMLRGQLLGTLGLEDLASNQAWSEEDINLVSGVTERIALALDNARLFQETQTALSETEQLYNIGLHINSAATLEDLLQAAIAPSIATDASSAGIWLFELDDAGQPAQMEFAVSWSRGGKPTMPLGTRLRAADFPSSQLWLNTSGQPSFVGNTAQDERLDARLRATFQQLNIAATGFMPLLIGNRWIGLIIVSWQEPHDFTPSEQRLYQSSASQVAVAVDNRRLLNQIRNDAERERTINRITSRLRNAQSVEQVLNIATQEVRAATHAAISVAEIAPTSHPANNLAPSGNGHAARGDA